MPFVKRTTAEAALQELRSGYDAAIAQAGLVLVQQTSAGADSHHVSPSCTDILGWDPTAFLVPGTLRTIVHVDDLAAFRTAGRDPGGEATVIRLRRADGTYGHFRLGVTDPGLHQPLTFAMVDVSSDAAARRSRTRAAELIDRSEEAVVILSLVDRGDPASFEISELNDAAVRLFHNSSAARLADVFADDTRQLLHNAAFDVAHTGEDLALRRLLVGELPEVVLDIVLSRLTDGTIAVRIADVTLQAAVEQRLRDRALHDQRSGLPNLAFLEEELSEAERSSGVAVGLFVVELTSSAEDGIHLADVAGRLAGTRTGSFVARIGEQRLALLVRDLLGGEELGVLAQTITTSLAAPFELNGAAIRVEATVGAAMSAPAESRSRLLRDAEDALRRATAQHRPWVIGSAEDRSGPTGLFHDVREGVGRGAMELRYQPIVDLRTGRISKVEALLRWADGDHHGEAPLELAERSGIPDVLPRWVIGEAAAATRWLADSGFDQIVSVNLGSANAVGELEGLVGLLGAEGLLTHGRLEVEVPESLVTEDPMAAAEMVDELHQMGMTVVIDDFGAGYTSLSAVSGSGVDGLKIDRSFIATLGTIPADEAVVRSTIELCHELGMSVTALGVTQAATAETLRAMGCDFAQGSWACEPVALDELPTRIADIQRTLV